LEGNIGNQNGDKKEEPGEPKVVNHLNEGARSASLGPRTYFAPRGTLSAQQGMGASPKFARLKRENQTVIIPGFAHVAYAVGC